MLESFLVVKLVQHLYTVNIAALFLLIVAEIVLHLMKTSSMANLGAE